MRSAWMLALSGVVALATCSSPAPAQQTIGISGDRLSGFVLPIEPLAAPVTINALRGWAWTVDDTKRLVLEGDVRVRLDGYDFTAPEAVIWLNRIPSAEGVINQFAMFFPSISDPGKRAGLDIAGDDILITASTRGEVRLDTAWLEQGQPKKSTLLKKADARLAEYLRGLAGQSQTLRDRPNIETAPPPPDRTFVPVPGGRVNKDDLDLPERIALPETTSQWMKEPQGIVRWSADRIDVSRGETENLITVDGSIVIDFIAERMTDDLSQLTLGAERAVIFTDPGPLDELATSQLEASAIRGIYLEGNVSVVAQGGDYVVRTPRAYYDFRRGQAIMLDSWLRLQYRDSKVPVHARAQEMRQIADNQWDAKNVIVSTSEFGTPHIALGSKRVMIVERPATTEDGPSETYIDADGNTMRVAGVPVVAWPRFKGSIDQVPLRSVAIGSGKNDGPFLRTGWDLFTLLGKEEPEGLQTEVLADAFFERGAGVGLDLKYDVGKAEGAVDLYGLYDTGEDLTSSGRDVEPESEFRGVALAEYQTMLTRYWSLQAQLSVISDPTFISSWRRADYAERREYETSLYLKNQKDNHALTVLASYSINDFLSNSYLLASRAYAVNKLPEFTYRRYGDSWFKDRFTFSTENRLSNMSMQFQHGTPNEIGVPARAFGIGGNDPIEDALFNAGLRENWVARFDSRNELAMPMQWGIFNVTPFIVGRFTGYNDDIEDWSSDSDTMRFFGAAGVRVNTSFQRVYNGVENQLFDVHRLRHVVEPYMTVWGASSNVDSLELPIYDQSVEPLQDGAAIQFGVRNTLQTQRGGPGNWQSVDYFVLDTSVLFTSEDAPNTSPTPQFFDYRPEYSQFGNSVHASAVWLLSDSLSIVGETTYVFDDNVFARGSIGTVLRHTPYFTTFVEYRFIEADDTKLLGVEWQYQLTSKYSLVFAPQYNFVYNDIQSLNFRITRSFPDFDLTLQVKYDAVEDDTSFGASLGFAEF